MPRLFKPIQRIPTGLRGPGGILKKLSLLTPCSSIASSQRNQGKVAIPTTFQRPIGAGSFCDPGVMGNEQTSLSPSYTSNMRYRVSILINRFAYSGLIGICGCSLTSSILNGGTLGTRTTSPAFKLSSFLSLLSLAMKSGSE